VQQVRDLNDRLLKQQRIIDQLHEQIKKLSDGQGGGGCDSNFIIQKVRRPRTVYSSQHVPVL